MPPLDREQTDKLKVALACFAMAAGLAFMLILLNGCGGMLTVGHQINEGANELHAAVMPVANAHCNKIAIKCKLSSPTLADCSAYKLADGTRSAFVTSINIVHAGAAELAVLSALDTRGDTDKIITNMRKQLDTAHKVALNAGWLQRSFFDGR